MFRIFRMLAVRFSNEKPNWPSWFSWEEGIERNVMCRDGSGSGECDDLIYEKLPHDIAERHVLLMDPILGTGNTVVRSIHVRLTLCFRMVP
jgi:hypothetical protein